MIQYSVAISPPDPVLEQVRQLKQDLYSAVGWYPSRNALAHITFNLFVADTAVLPSWEAYVEIFAAQQAPVSLVFDHTGSFPNGAFFLAPDEASERLLVAMMKAFHQLSPLPSKHQSLMPHMSIGRKLKGDQLAIANTLIQEVTICFTCHDLVLRRFNEARKQYDIYKRFPFGKGFADCYRQH